MIIKILEKFFEGNFFLFVLRKLLTFLVKKNFLNLKLSVLVKLNLTERPHYLYCLYHSAKLAKNLGKKKISVIEFGVAGGNGIVFLEKYQKKILEELGIEIEIYGFDLGSGLNKPVDHRDLPYWFKEELYKMDLDKLNKKISKAKLIIGDVKFTIKDFFKKYNPAPIAAVFNDLDYYSSTKNSFQIFNNKEDKFYLPRIFCYFDDTIGSEKEMYGEHNGELLAIKEFNNENINKKINLNQNLLVKNIHYKYQIYYLHNFEHKNFNEFIYKNEQSKLDSVLNLK